MVICNAPKAAYDFLGNPEGELAIAQAVIYLATAPKSNAAYKAFGAAMRAAKEGGSLLPPKHILNSPTKLMKSEGYGSGYEYDHDTQGAFSGQDYFPEAMGRVRGTRELNRPLSRIRAAQDHLGVRVPDATRHAVTRRRAGTHGHASEMAPAGANSPDWP